MNCEGLRQRGHAEAKLAAGESAASEAAVLLPPDAGAGELTSTTVNGHVEKDRSGKDGANGIEMNGTSGVGKKLINGEGAEPCGEVGKLGKPPLPKNLSLVVLLLAAFGGSIFSCLRYPEMWTGAGFIEDTAPVFDNPFVPFGKIAGRALRVRNGAVAAPDKRCSDIGRDILLEGGNAVDAAIASALCLGVVHPMSSGIGGGMFMLIRMANGTAEVIDCRETAPRRISKVLYRRDFLIGNVRGGMAVAVPGEIAGMRVAWERHGKLPWSRLFHPAVELARDGFVVGPVLGSAIRRVGHLILDDPGLSAVFAPEGRLLQAEDTCRNLKLARTLSEIGSKGASVLYGGDLGRQLAADIAKAEGLLDTEDLATYKAVVRRPLVAHAFGYKILGAPPPSSGGAAVALIIKTLEKLNEGLRDMDARGLHRLAEAFKHTFALRASLGDPAFVKNATRVCETLASDAMAEILAANIDDERTFPSEHYATEYEQPRDGGTNHLSVVDKHRNAVAFTATINSYFGAAMMSPSTGIVLNNNMDDFSRAKPNYFGLAPAPANSVAPRKRPLSSMAPTIVEKDGQFIMAIGASGGPRIISTIAQYLVLILGGGWKLEDAFAVPKMHHQLVPNELEYESIPLDDVNITLPEETLQGLMQRNHTVKRLTFGMAPSQIIVQEFEEADPLPESEEATRMGVLTAVSDVRKDGYPSGY